MSQLTWHAGGGRGGRALTWNYTVLFVVVVIGAVLWALWTVGNAVVSTSGSDEPNGNETTDPIGH